MKKSEEFIKSLNQLYGTDICGLSPIFGINNYEKRGNRIIVKNFGNGLGRILYVDKQNRLIASVVDKI